VLLAATLLITTLSAAQGPQTSREFREQLAKYKDAQQWNLVVIYAQDWVRKTPREALAWNELSLAYARLQQNEESLEAAKRAAQLSNKEPILWANLGYAHLAVKESGAAQKAFEEAVRLNPNDARSLTEIGVIYLRAGKDHEAKYAFDSAIAANPEYSEAICGQAWIAVRQRRVNDARQYVRVLNTNYRACADDIQREIVRIASAPPDKFHACRFRFAQSADKPEGDLGMEAFQQRH
jgi:tetratricopeptide (TPR) repeat protein